MPFPLHTIHLLGSTEKTLQRLDELKKEFTLFNKVSLKLSDEILESFSQVIKKNTSIRCVEFIIDNQFCFPNADIFKDIRDNPNIRYIILDFMHVNFHPGLLEGFLGSCLIYAISSEQYAFSVELRNLNLAVDNYYDSATLKIFAKNLLFQTHGLKTLIFTSFLCEVKDYEAIGIFRQALATRQTTNLTVFFDGINPNLPFYRELLSQNAEHKIDYSHLQIGLGYTFKPEVFTQSRHKKEEKMSMINDDIFSEFNKPIGYTTFDFSLPSGMSYKDLKKLITRINTTRVSNLVLNNICSPSKLSIFNEIEFNKDLNTINLEIKIDYSEPNPCVIDLLLGLMKNFVRGNRTVVLRLDDIRFITDFEEKWRLFVNECRLRTIIYINTEDAFNILRWSEDNFHIKVYNKNEYSDLFFYFTNDRYTSERILGTKRNPGSENFDIAVARTALEIAKLNDSFFAIKQQAIYLKYQYDIENIDITNSMEHLINLFITCCQNLLIELGHSQNYKKKAHLAIKKTKNENTKEEINEESEKVKEITEVPQCVQELGHFFLPFYHPEIDFETIQKKLNTVSLSNNNNNATKEYSQLLLDCESLISKFVDLHVSIPQDILKKISAMKQQYIDSFEPKYQRMLEKNKFLEVLHSSKPDQEMEEQYNQLHEEYIKVIETLGMALKGEIPAKYIELGNEITISLTNYKTKNNTKKNESSKGGFIGWGSLVRLLNGINSPSPQDTSNDPDPSQTRGAELR